MTIFKKIARWTAACVLTLSMSGVASAQDFYRIENRWKPTERINTQSSTEAQSTIVPDAYSSAHWEIEFTRDVNDPNENFIRLKNRWRNSYLGVENGRIVTTPELTTGRHSSWILQGVGTTGFFRLQNAGTLGYLNNQNGQLEVGAVQPSWWSAMWSIKDLDGKILDRRRILNPTIGETFEDLGDDIVDTAETVGNDIGDGVESVGDKIVASDLGQWFTNGEPGPKSITFRNEGVFAATMNVTYFIKQANGIPFEVKRSTGEITLGRRMHINIPDDLFPIPVIVEIRSRATNKSELLTEAVDVNFTGNRCFKSYGSIFDAQGSTC